jgi:integrase
MRNDFTLFQRTYPNGTKVFFYYAYDNDGQRKGPWTTKCVNRTAAKNYCHRLFKDGALLPDKKKPLTFGEFAEGFWARGSEYVKNQESRADITDTYINNCHKMLVNQILPFFANSPMEKITDKDVNSWLLGFKERKVQKDGKTEIVRYQNTYANTVFGTFNVMLAEAVRQGFISANPCDKVKRLKNDRKKITILTDDEVKKLFPKNIKSIWGDRIIAFAACRLASLTGMRIGEILGLRGEYVFDKHIHVCGQYGDEGYLPYTKNKENRNIPLIPEIIALLRGFKNGNGYVFSLTGGDVPVTQAYVRKAFHQALKKIGINEAEIKRRALTLHSWRHYLNTELLKQGLTIPQVQGVTGHKSVGMTERYNHLEAQQITDVMKAQAAIAGTQKTEKQKPQRETGKAKGNSKGLKIVKMPVRKSA